MNQQQLQSMIDQYKVFILDGAMATELEKRGLDIHNELWSAKAIIENPDLIKQVHLDYFKAGADIATTNTYQANLEGFLNMGLSPEEARACISKAVKIAVEARDEFWNGLSDEEKKKRPFPLVAGSIGPYGAFLANGAEYTGDYSLTDEAFQTFHLPRMQLVKEAGADLFAFETMPQFQETKVLARMLAEFFPDMAAWMSFSVSDGQMICDGTPLQEAAAYFDALDQVVAIGLNCTSCFNASCIIEKMHGVISKPIVVYPNSGETYDPVSKTWSHQHGHDDFGQLAQDFYQHGARFIGGCCRTTPEDIRQIAERVRTEEK